MARISPTKKAANPKKDDKQVDRQLMLPESLLLVTLFLRK
jgi:hypothetical protein